LLLDFQASGRIIVLEHIGLELLLWLGLLFFFFLLSLRDDFALVVRHDLDELVLLLLLDLFLLLQLVLYSMGNESV
jgi:hypothetical protein